MSNVELNRLIMQEIGLAVDNRQKVYDQDTGPIQYKEKNLKFAGENSVIISNKDMPFNPAENPFVMASLFDHYGKKIEEEEGISISRFCEVQDNTGKSALDITTNNGTFRTNFYNNDSLKYVDAIQYLNGSDPNLNEYDYDKKPEKGTIKKKKQFKF